VFLRWLPLRDPNEPIGPGDLVELLGGQISRKMTGEGPVFVVSTQPMLMGNVPEAEELANGRAIVFIGQAPVRVVGAVKAMQSLVPSGRDDGTAKAVDGGLSRIIAMADCGADDDGGTTVRALVNAGCVLGPLSRLGRRVRSRKQQHKNNNKKRTDEDDDGSSDSFVLVKRQQQDYDAESTVSDLETLAATHECVRKLVDEMEFMRKAMRHAHYRVLLLTI
jgi:hypothetical protein